MCGIHTCVFIHVLALCWPKMAAMLICSNLSSFLQMTETGNVETWYKALGTRDLLDLFS